MNAVIPMLSKLWYARFVGQDVGQRFKNFHLAQRNGWYWYERRIPKDIAVLSNDQKVRGKTRLRFSLKTKDKTKARLKRDSLNIKYEKEWEGLRAAAERGGLPDPIEVRQEYLTEPNDGEHLLEYAETLGLDTSGDPPAEHIEWYETVIGQHQPLQPQVDKFLEMLVDEGKKATAADYRRGYSLLAEFVTDAKKVDKIFASSVMRKLQDREGVQKTTVEKWIHGYSSLWNFIGLDASCWKGIRLQSSGKQNNRKPFTAREVIRIHDHLKQQGDWVLHPFWIAVHTGARQGAIADLEYDKGKKLIHFPAQKKEDEDRDVPAHTSILPSLEEWVANRKSKRSIGRRFSEAKSKLGFGQDKVFHSTRHTFITAMAEIGCHPVVSTKITGHAFGNTHVDRYTGDLTNTTLRGWIEKLDYYKLKEKEE